MKADGKEPASAAVLYAEVLLQRVSIACSALQSAVLAIVNPSVRLSARLSLTGWHCVTRKPS